MTDALEPVPDLPQDFPGTGLMDPADLYPQQKMILGAPEDGYVIVTGGAGTVKTSGCVLKLYQRAVRDFRVRDMVLMQTKEQISRVFIDQWEWIVPQAHYTVHREDENWYIKLFNGARLILQYADHPKAADRIRGGNYTGYFISQAESLTYQSLVEEIEFRVRIPGVEHLRMLDANGGNPARPALQRYVESSSAGYHGGRLQSVPTKSAGITVRTGRAKNAHRFTHIHIRTTAETSVYGQADIDGFRATLSPVAFARMVDGKNVLDEGLVYQDWNAAVHVRTFAANPGWAWYRGIDFGFENPFVCLWIGVDSDDRFWIHQELYRSKMLIDESIREIQERTPDDIKPRVTYADPSGAANIMALTRAGIATLGGLNKVDPGIAKVRRLLRTRADGLPGLFVHPSCEKLIFEFSVYEMAKSSAAVPVPTAPRKVNDHALDALRYVAASVLAHK